MSYTYFNVESAASRYLYVPSPMNERAFLILKKDSERDIEIPAGDYTVLDTAEDIAQSEKKVMNIVSLLNNRRNLMDLGSGTQIRTQYQIITESDDENRAQIMFFALGDVGVSIENALLRIDSDEIRDFCEGFCDSASDSSKGPRYTQSELAAADAARHRVSDSRPSV